MKKFISYFIVFIIGFVVCLGVLFRWYGAPGSTGPVLAPVVDRGGVGFGKAGANPVRNAAEVASSYVVNIDTVGRARVEQFPDFFGIPFGPTREQIRKGEASGVIYTSDGYILTNNHVVEDASQLTVTLHNGRSYPAELIGRDPKSDLAVIKINEKNLPYAKFADSNTLDVGDWVLAVGNALGLGPTVTVGVVSAKRTAIEVDGKKIEGAIQTDAAINRGNSGGALADINGNLVGINTAIYSSSPNGGNIGIGFAIPSNNALRIAKQLQEHGQVVRPWLGIGYGPYNADVRKIMERQGYKNLPKSDGALVRIVYDGSPAEAAGLKSMDVILKINGKPVAAADSEKGRVSIADAVSKAKVGDRLELSVWKASNRRVGNVAVKLQQMPADFGSRPQQ